MSSLIPTIADARELLADMFFRLQELTDKTGSKPTKTEVGSVALLTSMIVGFGSHLFPDYTDAARYSGETTPLTTVGAQRYRLVKATFVNLYIAKAP